MNRIPRALRPLLLAFFCWMLVLLVPATRQSFWTAWTNRFEVVQEEYKNASFDYLTLNRDAKELLQRFPNDKEVKLYAAVNENATKWLENDPQNVVLVALALKQQIAKLNFDRIDGPLTNPNYPLPASKIPAASPSPNPNVGKPQNYPSSEEWSRFIALARRGQKLEPNNTFFDWMLLYALYATRQDAKATEVLARASRKTAYDDHQREVILNRLKVLHLLYGYPLSPRDQYSIYSVSVMGSTQYGKMRQTSRWVMESAIADRQQKQHDQALDKAFDLMRLSRVLRRESYSLIDSLVGTACEMMALSSITPRIKKPAKRKARIGDPLPAFQSDSRMLYFYAKSQKRSDITTFSDTEWVELGKWRKLGDVIINQPWTGNSTAQTMTLTASERFATFVVKVLPSILILIALFAILSRRLPYEADASFTLWRVALWRGAWFGVVIWPLAMLCDALIVWRTSDADEMLYSYVGTGGLSESLSSWLYCGMAGAAICLGLNLAVAWQKEQADRRISLRSRLKAILKAPEDGLVRYDFGWLFGLTLHLTSWILLLGGIFWFSFQQKEISSSFDGSLGISLVLMIIALIVSIVFSLYTWRTLPRRRLTLRLSFRLIANTLSGFLVLTSVLYTVVAFALLPLAFQYERNFENAMQKGELAIARAKTGL